MTRLILRIRLWWAGYWLRDAGRQLDAAELQRMCAMGDEIMARARVARMIREEANARALLRYREDRYRALAAEWRAR